KGDIETDVTLSGWAEGLPHQVEIRRPVQGFEADLRLDTVERNVPAPERAFVAIIGPSGCGKSTLLHLLGGLARPTSGRIVVDGVEVSAAGDFERTAVRRQKIGFVFQRFNLFPTLTVRGNLEIARQIQGNGVPPKDELVGLLEMVGLPHKMDMKPLDLSAGEQQRIAIARALVNKPAIVL